MYWPAERRYAGRCGEHRYVRISTRWASFDGPLHETPSKDSRANPATRRGSTEPGIGIRTRGPANVWECLVPAWVAPSKNRGRESPMFGFPVRPCRRPPTTRQAAIGDVNRPLRLRVHANRILWGRVWNLAWKMLVGRFGHRPITICFHLPPRSLAAESFSRSPRSTSHRSPLFFSGVETVLSVARVRSRRALALGTGGSRDPWLQVARIQLPRLR